jgi:hypothetical protein
MRLTISALLLIAACDGDTGAGTDGGGGGTDGGGGNMDARAPGDAAPYDAQPGMPQGTCTEPDPPFSAQEQMLVDLPAGTWWQPPGTLMRDVCPEGAWNCNNAIDAWSGGAYDDVHDRMLVFGGGHGDYSGNELYAFAIGTLSWSLLTQPSSPDLANEDPLPDGQPVSRHSYDGLSYITQADRFLAHGGSRWQDGSGTDVTWTFDGVAWRNMMPADEPPFTNCCSEASAYDATTGRVIFHLTSRLHAYDYDENRWIELADLTYPPLWPRYEAWGDKRGLFDTRRGLAWFLGAGLVMVYEAATGEFVTEDWVTTGGTAFSNAEHIGGHTEQLFETTGAEIIEATAPAADYDPVADDIVAWVGGGVWVLDLESKVWTRGSSAGAPTEPTQHGTFGRFRYIPRTNVFILVNSVDEDVWFYKHTVRCGT